MIRPLFLLLAIPLLLSGCVSDFYARVQPGKFHGKCTLEAVGVDHQNDYPLYMLRQDARDPFRFERANGEVIQPRTMLTSGGNVPWFLQFGPDLNPGAYWDAYVIHDWLYDAHRRRLPEVSQYTVKDAAMILAEGQKTMMEGGRSRIMESQWAYGHGTVKSARRMASRNPFMVFATYVASQTPFAHVPWISHRFEPVAAEYEVLGVPIPVLKRVTQVNLHLARESQRDEATDLATRLSTVGIEVLTISVDPKTAPSRLEVRYSRTADHPEAVQVADFVETNRQFGRARIVAIPATTQRDVSVWYPDGRGLR